MKYFLMAMLLTFCVSCTSRTEFGPCVGAFDDKNPTKIYKVSIWNVFLGIIGSELILPPLFVIVDETFCPVGNK